VTDDGTPLRQEQKNDFLGFAGALMNAASIVPNNIVDDATASQIFDALEAKIAADMDSRVEGYIIQPPIGFFDNSTFDTSTETTSPTGVGFKPDGTKMYILDTFADAVLQYTLSTPWDLSTASYDSVSFSVAGQDSGSAGLEFKPDGTKMYMSGLTGSSVYQYTLSTPWDLSTASYDSVSLSVAGQESTPLEVRFKPDGTKMYIVGNTSDNVHQYTLSTPWDLSTASYDSVSFSVAGQETSPQGMEFKPDGTKMYIAGNVADAVLQYTLSTPWDLSTASYDSVSLSVAGQVGASDALFFKPSGDKMYLVSGSINSVLQYNTGFMRGS
jgi:sugar lactone lactonase YvrE